MQVEVISMDSNEELDLVERKVGLAIRSLRKLRGITRKELAEILQVSHQQVAKYENAQNRITAGKLFMLANIFNVSIDYFFSDGFIPANSSSSSSNRDQIEVARNYMAINSTKKREAIRLLTKILAEEN